MIRALSSISTISYDTIRTEVEIREEYREKNDDFIKGLCNSNDFVPEAVAVAIAQAKSYIHEINNIMWCDAMRCDAMRRDMTKHNRTQHNTMQYNMIS